MPAPGIVPIAPTMGGACGPQGMPLASPPPGAAPRPGAGRAPAAPAPPATPMPPEGSGAPGAPALPGIAAGALFWAGARSWGSVGWTFSCGGARSFAAAFDSFSGASGISWCMRACTAALSPFRIALSNFRRRLALYTIEILFLCPAFSSLHRSPSGGHLLMTGRSVSILSGTGTSESILSWRPSEVQKHQSEDVGHGNFDTEKVATFPVCAQSSARTSSSCFWLRTTRSPSP
mmetsp:Transcript_23014/g.64255  ORF Transcript_23014/g.64255 Transcript_23014/m.64255 type:complete len:233 (+) Transcript_23014:257-955(+)